MTTEVHSDGGFAHGDQETGSTGLYSKVRGSYTHKVMQPYTGNLSHEKPYEWRDDASCRDEPYHLFEMLEEGSPLALGKKDRPLKTLNAHNFDQAKKICDSCPVIEQCGREAAANGDHEFTFRAGIYPRQFRPRGRGRPAKGTVITYLKTDEPCPSGHVGFWLPRVDSGGKNSTGRYCAECNRIRLRKARADAKMEA